MSEENNIIKKFKPFVLGFCKCGNDISIRSKRGYLKRFCKGHNMIGDSHPKWKDGKAIDSLGYNRIAGKYTHIHIYQNHFKCCILPWCVIHHRDGNKQNNEISNLQITTRSNHRRIHFGNDSITGRFYKKL